MPIRNSYRYVPQVAYRFHMYTLISYAIVSSGLLNFALWFA